jgi:hypothetical protein
MANRHPESPENEIEDNGVEDSEGKNNVHNQDGVEILSNAVKETEEKP